MAEREKAAQKPKDATPRFVSVSGLETDSTELTVAERQHLGAEQLKRKGTVIRNPARSRPHKGQPAQNRAVCVRSGSTLIASTKKLAGPLLTLSQVHRAGSAPLVLTAFTRIWTYSAG